MFTFKSSISLSTLSILFLLTGCAGCITTESNIKTGSPVLEAKAKEPEIDRLEESRVAEVIGTRIAFHNAALKPEWYVSKDPKDPTYPLYILGIEKTRENADSLYKNYKNITPDKNTPSISIENLNDIDKKDIESALDNQNPMVLTHILDTKPSNSQSKGCFVYNIYQDETNNSSWCANNPDPVTKIEKGNGTWTNEGWKALNRLKAEIEAAVQREKATHIIVLATGWHTKQYESYRDFIYWMRHLSKDFENSGKDFRPIFIGISWESGWRNCILDYFPSFGVVRNDADEIGYTWVNYLLNDVLKPVAASSNQKPQLVAIGHSLGVRVILGAHYVRDLIVRKPQPKSDNYPITLIGLQGAFPINRFIKGQGDNYLYSNKYKNKATVILTSSSKDTATGKMKDYIGGKNGLDELYKNPKTYGEVIKFPILTTLDTDQPEKYSTKEDKVYVYDVTSFVDEELTGKGGGAHNDVFDPKMGKFLGEIIRQSNQQK